MEGIGEEIGQKASLGVLHAGDIRDEAQGGAVANAPHHRIQADGFKLWQIGLGANPVVPQKHHGFLAQLVGDVHHFFCQGGHLPALEGHKVFKLLGGHPVLVVVIALVDDKLRPEFVTCLLLEPLQDVGGDRGGIAVPVHVLLSFQLIKDKGKLVEEGGVPDDIHMGVAGDEFLQPLHGELPGLGLADVKGDLVLKVLPAVGDGVVHMHRVPDEVGQKADGVIVEVLRAGDGHRAGGGLVIPALRRHRLPGGAVHHLPPASYVIPAVYLQQLLADSLQKGDGQGAAGSGVKAGHDVTLLDLIGVGLGPGVVLAGGVVGGIDLGVHLFQGVRIVGAVAVPDGIGTPALQQLQGLGHHVHVGGDGHPAFGQLFAHIFFLLMLKGFVVNHQRRQQQHHTGHHQPQTGQLSL